MILLQGDFGSNNLSMKGNIVEHIPKHFLDN